jgi:hypothetical protein
VLRFFVIITEKLGEGQQERNDGARMLLSLGRGMDGGSFARSRNSSVWITLAGAFPAPKAASPEKFSALHNLNRQTRVFRNAVTYRKQSTANCANRQNVQKPKSMFFAAIFSPARTPKRTPNAPTRTEL